MIAWKQVLYLVQGLNWKFLISAPEIVSIGDGPYWQYVNMAWNWKGAKPLSEPIMTKW